MKMSWCGGGGGGGAGGGGGGGGGELWGGVGVVCCCGPFSPDRSRKRPVFCHGRFRLPEQFAAAKGDIPLARTDCSGADAEKSR